MNSFLVLSLLVLVPFCFASSKEGYGYKTIKCYQCAYSPPRTEYKQEKYKTYETDHYGKQQVVYKTRYVPVSRRGGWEPCKGPFSDYDALSRGIDVWDCHDNCYTRLDDNGNIFRGCYKDEYGVDPKKLGCNRQAGSTYCFCEGDKCNNKAVPYPGH
jgi:hypothetical protein